MAFGTIISALSQKSAAITEGMRIMVSMGMMGRDGKRQGDVCFGIGRDGWDGHPAGMEQPSVERGRIYRRIAMRVLTIATMAMGLAGCGSEPISAFKDGRPLFEPERYFAGETHSWGIIETPSGKPKRVLHTYTTGVREGRSLHFEQQIVFGGGDTEHRSWVVRRLDEHHYSATGTGIIGVARGEAWGDVFHLDFTLDAWPGNPLGHVHMSQWMYLQPDGVTLVNRDTLTKGGVIIAEITEEFQKDR